jgi:hypothetical protein
MQFLKNIASSLGQPGEANHTPYPKDNVRVTKPTQRQLGAKNLDSDEFFQKSVCGTGSGEDTNSQWQNKPAIVNRIRVSGGPMPLNLPARGKSQT